MTTISARDAYELTKEKIENLKNKEIDDVFESISKAIENGNFETCFNKNLFDENITLLRELGYTVSYNDGYGKTTVKWTTVKWLLEE